VLWGQPIAELETTGSLEVEPIGAAVAHDDLARALHDRLLGEWQFLTSLQHPIEPPRGGLGCKSPAGEDHEDLVTEQLNEARSIVLPRQPHLEAGGQHGGAASIGRTDTAPHSRCKAEDLASKFGCLANSSR